jgi:hypothetical protein
MIIKYIKNDKKIKLIFNLINLSVNQSIVTHALKARHLGSISPTIWRKAQSANALMQGV